MDVKTLSVVVAVSEPITKEFYLQELLVSVLPLADEVIVVNGDNLDIDNYLSSDDGYDLIWKDSETLQIVRDIEYGYDTYGLNYSDVVDKIKVIYNPWEDGMKKNMYWLQKSIAISHASCDYILRLDADEVVHEEDYSKIMKCLELGYDVYSFRTLHFYRDFKHIKIGRNVSDGNNPWYKRRPYLFKNGLGIWENQQDLVGINGNFLPCKHTSIKIHHYGHVRSKECYIQKKNMIEKSYHNDWIDIDESSFSWDMSGTIKYTGTYPKSMKKRIEGFK